MEPTTLDHVAIAVPDRDGIAAWLCANLEVHVIERTERLTLLGADATAGKITLLDAAPADGAAPPATRVDRLVSLVLAQPAGRASVPLVHPAGLVITFDDESPAAQAAPRHALIGATLRSDDPVSAAASYAASWGFVSLSAHRDVAVVGVGDSSLTLARDTSARDDLDRRGSVLVDHIGLLVGSAEQHAREARDAGLEVDWVDAPNTLAAFVTGPEGVRLEYVEHKPEFALA